MISAEESYKILFERIKNSPPYKPTSSWCLHDGFKPDLLLNKKRKFVLDEFLHPKSTVEASKFEPPECPS
jgi:hypothetical protein